MSAKATVAGSDAGPAAQAASEAGIAASPPPSLLTTGVPTFKPRAPPLPPPTPQQLASYQAMRQEAETYERGARDYKDTLTTIITLHYEEKKKSILGGLDREIGIEKDQLKGAREIAIKRLEEFVAKYSGPSAQPESTPDAMYRLAALYEERARSDDDPNADLAVSLQPAIALYKRVLREFPKYRELSGIYYFLGHALGDSRRTDEAQQVWRSLVCNNHYAYPTATDPKDPNIDKVSPLPQDHDDAYWKRWRGKFTRPEDLKKGSKEESTFIDPYPRDCTPIPQPGVLPGQDPKYVAEIWWRIGDWEFDQADVGGGVVEYEPFAVWDYNRAASAYTQAMQYKRPPLYGVALYKYAWTLFKQQRYEAAVREFVHLLNYTDEQQKLTGDPGADFRQEAYTYVAGSLDNFDFVGPGPDDPYVARPDVLDTAKSPADAETKLRVALERVQDPRLVPQDKPWTIEIYKALALEFRTINQYKNALATYQMMLDKWPMDPSAPDTQNSMAEVYELLTRQTKVGDERRDYERKVLEARTALAKYIGDTPWVDANKDNPNALQRAEELVRTGLKGAAITHTRNGQAAVEQADQTGDPKEKLRLTVFALQEYKLAALGWQGYLKQDENAPDAYKSRYFYADALHNQVRLEVALHQFDPRQYGEPTSVEIASAEQAATDVRDSDEDDQFIDNAGLFVVDLADVDRDLAFQRWQDSGGTQGGEPRKPPRLEGPTGDQKVVVDDIPEVLLKSMKARDEYIQRVPPERDKLNHAADYAFYSADQLYLYGHFKEAQDRFTGIYEQHCGKDALGYEAWKRLIVMSNLQKDAARSRQLAEAEKAKSCAKTELQVAEEKKGDLTDLVLQNAAFEDANKIFEQAKAAPPGPQRDALWRKAGKMYEDALRAAPSHKDAPAAAINSAFCYKQVGEFSKAIELYDLFISNYGSEDILGRLEHGGMDPDKKENVPPNPDEYKERIKYLGLAYDALSTTYYGFFAYQRAAESFGKIAANARFDDDRRANASRIAMVLYSNLGDRGNMGRMYALLVDPKMHLSADKRAEADYLRASFDYGQWNPNGGESGGNSAARRQAMATLMQFHTASKNRPESGRYELESSYRVAKMMQSANDPAYKVWFKTAVADWEYLKMHPVVITSPDGKQSQVSATDAPYSDYGGEADFNLVDDEVRAGFDYATGHHHYAGNVVDITKQVDKDLGEAEKTWRPRLERVATQYGSFEWAAAATARLGTLYDSIRTGLDLVVPAYFTPQQEALLKKLSNVADKLDAAGQSDKADQVRTQIDDTKDAVRTKWRTTKDQYMEVCNQKMISRYVAAALTARKYNVKNAAVQAAVSRLAFFTDYLGDDKMKGYVENTGDPLDPNSKLVYVNGEFLQWRSGVVSTPPASGEPAPLPASP
ncbi:MAG: tetratricopeptide repeat protein [Myxococcota bacterium]|nr:tetratricopeptide repeat protein [Myxococcota bacterium]